MAFLILDDKNLDFSHIYILTRDGGCFAYYHPKYNTNYVVRKYEATFVNAGFHKDFKYAIEIPDNVAQEIVNKWDREFNQALYCVVNINHFIYSNRNDTTISNPVIEKICGGHKLFIGRPEDFTRENLKGTWIMPKADKLVKITRMPKDGDDVDALDFRDIRSISDTCY